MKKIITLIMAAILSIGAISARDTFTSDPKALPAGAQKTLTQFFKKAKVDHIKIDRNIGGADYDVILNDGTEIEFNSHGELKEVESYSGIPTGLMPAAVGKYLNANYKGQKIVKLDVKRNKYELELQSGIELEFDRSGRFLRLDR